MGALTAWILAIAFGALCAYLLTRTRVFNEPNMHVAMRREPVLLEDAFDQGIPRAPRERP